VDVQLYSFFNLSSRWWWVIKNLNPPHSPGKAIRYSLYGGRLSWALGWSGRVRKVSLPIGIRSQDRPDEGMGNAIIMLIILLSRSTNAQHILIMFYISSVLLHVSIHLHHLQGVVSFYFAKFIKFINIIEVTTR